MPCQGQKLHLSLQRPNTTHWAPLMLTCPTCGSICALPGEEAAHQAARVEPDAVPPATLPLPLPRVSITSGPHPDSYRCPLPCRLHGACECLVGCDCQARGLRVALQGWGLCLAQQPLMFCRGQGRPESHRVGEWELPGARAESRAAVTCALQVQCREGMTAVLGASCRIPGHLSSSHRWSVGACCSA